MPIGGTAYYGQNQHPRITTTYLNQLNRHGDPAPGVPVSTAQTSGMIVQPYSGFIGGKLTITNPWATQFGDPAVGPLYGGVYMYARLDPNATGPLARGTPVFWLDELNYIITAVGMNAVTTKPNKNAGVALNATFAGYWDFIQILGIASIKYTTAGNIGDPVTIDPTQTPPTVTPGTPTLATMENGIGVAVLTAPVAGQVSPVELNIQQGLNF